MFIDCAKTFDCVDHSLSWKAMTYIGVPPIHPKHSVYTSQKSTVRLNGQYSKEFLIRKGIRLGYIMSPHLFNMYGKQIMQTAQENMECRVSIRGRNIKELRCADDTSFITLSKNGWHALT